MKAQEFLKKFSTKKDALTAIDTMVLFFNDRKQEWSGWDNDLELWLTLKKDIESYTDKELSQQVMDLFNSVNNTQYKNTEKISAIVRQVPKCNYDQFESIVFWCKEVWGSDNVMSQYNTPYTLFGSKQKFLKYLETSTNYWIQKSKRNGNSLSAH